MKEEKENILNEDCVENESQDINEDVKKTDSQPDNNACDENCTKSDEEENTNESQKEKDPLATALEEIEQLKDKYLRSVAEFDNYRKRTLKEKAELILNGSEKAVQAMLPVIDDMELAIVNSEKLIYQKTNKILESIGVKKINTENADFDTNYHEAVAMVPGMGDEKKGKVLDCVQAGYTLNDKVIRHAKVAVGQ